MVVSDQFVLCKAALIFAFTRWLLSLALNLLTGSSDSTTQASTGSSCCSSSSNLRIMRERLCLTTLENIQPESKDLSCAVCLNRLKKGSQVWQLSNCNHVFHRNCLERWMCYDNRMTCPLCRASLVTVPSSPLPAVQPSWAVERMLYLFGDDLLPVS